MSLSSAGEAAAPGEVVGIVPPKLSVQCTKQRTLFEDDSQNSDPELRLLVSRFMLRLKLKSSVSISSNPVLTSQHSMHVAFNEGKKYG